MTGRREDSSEDDLRDRMNHWNRVHEKRDAANQTRIAALEERLTTVENALSRMQSEAEGRRGSLIFRRGRYGRRQLIRRAENRVHQERYRPELRSMTSLMQRVGESAKWDNAYMGMDAKVFEPLLQLSYTEFLRSVLVELFAPEQLNRMTLGRASGESTPMPHDKRDCLNRLVAAFYNYNHYLEPTSFAQLSKDVSHVISNAKKGRKGAGNDDPGEGSSRYRSESGGEVRPQEQLRSDDISDEESDFSFGSS